MSFPTGIHNHGITPHQPVEHGYQGKDQSYGMQEFGGPQIPHAYHQHAQTPAPESKGRKIANFFLDGKTAIAGSPMVISGAVNLGMVSSMKAHVPSASEISNSLQGAIGNIPDFGFGFGNKISDILQDEIPKIAGNISKAASSATNPLATPANVAAGLTLGVGLAFTLPWVTKKLISCCTGRNEPAVSAAPQYQPSQYPASPAPTYAQPGQRV